MAQTLVSINGISGARSSGTSLWVDTDTPDLAVKLQAHMRHHGVIAKLNGQSGVVAHPALLAGEQQVSELFKSFTGFK